MTDFESLCSEGMDAAADIDKGRWRLGDLACQVKTEYGRDMIGKFASRINVPKARVAEYRRVATFYPEKLRGQLFDDYPDGLITYTHMRDAMRFKELDKALAFIEECAVNTYTTDHAAVEIQKRLGRPVPPPKLLDGLAHVLSIRGDVVTFRVDAALETALYDAMNKRLPVSIVVRTSEDEPDFKRHPIIALGNGYHKRIPVGTDDYEKVVGL